mgnify:CR=1 FL=1
MAGTTSTSVQQLYADIVADLIPYYMDAVLLPNQQIIQNSLVVSGSSGSQVRFPLTNSYTNAADVAEGASIEAAAQSNLVPTAANVYHKIIRRFSTSNRYCWLGYSKRGYN